MTAPRLLQKRTRLILGFLLLAVLVGAGAYAWFSLSPFAPLQPAAVERDVNAALPTGSSLADIRAYLANRGYSFSEPFPAKEDTEISMLASDVPPNAQVLWAIVDKNTRWWFDTTTGRVYLYFVLDPENKLDRVLVTEHLSGP